MKKIIKLSIFSMGVILFTQLKGASMESEKLYNDNMTDFYNILLSSEMSCDIAHMPSYDLLVNICVILSIDCYEMRSEGNIKYLRIKEDKIYLKSICEKVMESAKTKLSQQNSDIFNFRFGWLQRYLEEKTPYTNFYDPTFSITSPKYNN